MDSTHYVFLHSLAWDEVFSIWRDNEADNPKWIGTYTKRGFTDWESWRKTYTEPLKCEQRQWELYHVVNPLEVVPGWCGGPFKTWIEKYYQGERTLPFAEIARQPYWRQRQDVQDLLRHFPGETTVIGLRTDQGITIIEGMHRCVALALAAAHGRAIATQLNLVIAPALGEVLPAVGQAVAEE